MISFKGFSKDIAINCLYAVLIDIKRNQAMLALPYIDNLEMVFRTINDQLKTAKTEQKQLLVQNKELLEVTRKKLNAAQSFVDQFSKEALFFKFDDTQFSASALLVSTILSKKNEIKDLGKV